MAGATRSTRLAFGALAVVLALSGCAGRSWQFWKSSSTTPKVTTVPASSPTPTAATPAGAAPETAAAAVPSGGDFIELTALPDVFFRPGFVTVGKADARTLDAVSRWLTENPGAQVRIEGHTDDLGSSGENLAIGQQRAASAMKYLVARGVDPARISAVSYGSDHPVCMEKTADCRAKNRRVHFLVKQP